MSAPGGNAAPYYAEIAEGPEGGRAVWARASDGVRIRVGLWPLEGAQGSIVLLPGRTEYIEKYGPAAQAFNARGYSMAAIDWRGQGLADRLLDDPLVGHVGSFDDYQKDLAAALAAMRAAGFPEPFFLIGHSMGGAIGLRALFDGIAVRAAMFSAPMWGILLPALRKPAAHAMIALSERFGWAHRRVPGSTAQSYVLTAPFEGNMLTHDPEMYAMMQRQTRHDPRLGLAGPSLHWLGDAILECAELVDRPHVDIPIGVHVGAEESIVSTAAVQARMADWPMGKLTIVPGARHEIMMEVPKVREGFYDAADALFQQRCHGAS